VFGPSIAPPGIAAGTEYKWDHPNTSTHVPVTFAELLLVLTTAHLFRNATGRKPAWWKHDSIHRQSQSTRQPCVHNLMIPQHTLWTSGNIQHIQLSLSDFKASSSKYRWYHLLTYNHIPASTLYCAASTYTLSLPTGRVVCGGSPMIQMNSLTRVPKPRAKVVLYKLFYKIDVGIVRMNTT
jgi:hypothetical protein